MFAMFSRLLNYRDLFIVYTWRELLVRYRQSIIGILWAIIQPLSMMALFVLIFGIILRTAHKEYPFVLFYYAGVLPWTFFSGATSSAIQSLTGNFTLITKIYFPREIIPLSGIAINFIDYLVGLVFYILLLLMYGAPFTMHFLWMVPLVLLMLLFTASFGCLLAGLNVYYRDVKLASNFLIQFLFFASPVVYSIDSVDNKWKLLLFLNPLTFLIENMRRVTIEGRSPVLWQFLVEAGAILLFFVFSWRIFIRIERAFADVI